MKKNNKWFSIVLAMWLVIFINLLALSILEYVIPFLNSTKQIENSMVAYYQANSWIEEALYVMKEKEPWDIDNDLFDTDFLGGVIDYKYDLTTEWKLLPPIWEWNSEYNDWWNQIAMWNPIQLEIWNKIDIFDSTDFYFRVPDLDWNWELELDWDSMAIVNWQISSENNTLNSSGSYLRSSDICDSCIIWDICSCNIIDFSWIKWVDLNWTYPYEIEDFYDNECQTSSCILKLSVINELKAESDSIFVPYLEWKIDFWTKEVPLRYSKISTIWKAYWYRKDLEVKISQETTNEAFDFTVFQ